MIADKWSFFCPQSWLEGGCAMVHGIAGMLEQGEGAVRRVQEVRRRAREGHIRNRVFIRQPPGRHILLGVNDDGSIGGVDEKSVVGIERNIVNVTSNPTLFNTSPGLEITHATVQGRCVIDVWVPMGPSVYRFKGVVYDRVADVDVRLKGDDQISAMYIRKQNLYTEQRIYPHVAKDDLDMSVLDRARGLMRAYRPGHPWIGLSDDELLRAARLKTKDFQTGEEGFNLASIVLLGRDETIMGVCPVYRTTRFCAGSTPTVTTIGLWLPRT